MNLTSNERLIFYCKVSTLKCNEIPDRCSVQSIWNAMVDRYRTGGTLPPPQVIAVPEDFSWCQCNKKWLLSVQATAISSRTYKTSWTPEVKDKNPNLRSPTGTLTWKKGWLYLLLTYRLGSEASGVVHATMCRARITNESANCFTNMTLYSRFVTDNRQQPA